MSQKGMLAVSLNFASAKVEFFSHWYNNIGVFSSPSIWRFKVLPQYIVQTIHQYRPANLAANLIGQKSEDVYKL